MTVELQIIEYRDCIRCYQPIDKRAELCSFCHSTQIIQSKWRGRIFTVLGVLAILSLPIVWFILSDLKSSNLALERAVDDQEVQLATTLKKIEANSLAHQQALGIAKTELDVLIQRAFSYSNNASTFCIGVPVLEVCELILNHSDKDSIAVSTLLGRFQSLGEQAMFCDLMRPMLRRLARNSTTELGRTLHKRYFLSSEVCWYERGVELSDS